MFAITCSIGKLIISTGGMMIGYLYRRRRSVHNFSRTLRRMGMPRDEAEGLTRAYRDMVSLPGLRQFTRHNEH